MLTAGLAPAWAGFLVDWDRTLRSGNYPPTTRYNYLLAASQLARYLAEQAVDHQGRPRRPFHPPIDAATHRSRVREPAGALHRLNVCRSQTLLGPPYRSHDLGPSPIYEASNEVVRSVPRLHLFQTVGYLKVLAVRAGRHVAVPERVGSD